MQNIHEIRPRMTIDVELMWQICMEQFKSDKNKLQTNYVPDRLRREYLIQVIKLDANVKPEFWNLKKFHQIATIWTILRTEEQNRTKHIQIPTHNLDISYGQWKWPQPFNTGLQMQSKLIETFVWHFPFKTISNLSNGYLFRSNVHIRSPNQTDKFFK